MPLHKTPQPDALMPDADISDSGFSGKKYGTARKIVAWVDPAALTLRVAGC